MGKPINNDKLPKYARESQSIPTTNIWWAQTKKLNTKIIHKEYNIAKLLNTQRNPIKSIYKETRPNIGSITI